MVVVGGGGGTGVIRPTFICGVGMVVGIVVGMVVGIVEGIGIGPCDIVWLEVRIISR